MRAFLVTGIPGAGKTTVARLLAERLPLAAHIEADRLQQMIVSGGRWPEGTPRGEAKRQLDLRARNAALLATSFYDAAIVPVIDDVVIGRDRLAIYEEILGDRPLRLVVLAPPLDVALARDEARGYKRVGDAWAHLDAEQREKLGGAGQWIDSGALTPDQTVERILGAAAGGR